MPQGMCVAAKVVSTVQPRKAPTMKISPWAKLMSRTMP